MNLVVNGRIGSQKLTQNNLQELMIITCVGPLQITR